LPLSSYADISAFKIFVLDIGLLGAMSDLDKHSIIKGNSIFEEFKGALSEQYVFQQIKNGIVYYWSSVNSIGEIDFLIQKENKIIPIEVKAEENLKAKSLKFFCRKYKTQNAIRTSMSDYRKEDWLVNIPLYAINLKVI
jgi:predicted AAA+ superfamily ATPase